MRRLENNVQRPNTYTLRRAFLCITALRDGSEPQSVAVSNQLDNTFRCRKCLLPYDTYRPLKTGPGRHGSRAAKGLDLVVMVMSHVAHTFAVLLQHINIIVVHRKLAHGLQGHARRTGDQPTRARFRPQMICYPRRMSYHSI